MDQSGLVLLAVAALWIAYLVPHRLRTRQELLEARVEDRFSEGLRVLRVAHAAGTGAARPAGHRPSDQRRLLIHSGGRGGGGGLVNRPHAARDRTVADAVRATATQHARRAAHLARRRAAARRRAVLTLALLVTAAVTWTLVGVVSLPVLAAVTPTVALAGVLVLGRRAVIAAARSDAEWAAGAADRVPLPGARTASRVTGRAAHPSDAVTEVISGTRPARSSRPTQRRDTSGPPAASASRSVARAGAPAPAAATAAVPDTAAGAAPVTAIAAATPPAEGAAPHRRPAAETRTAPDRGPQGDRQGTPGRDRPAACEPSAGRADEQPFTGSTPVAAQADEPSWVPVPVPRPTYTLKPSAPRREPAPLPTEGLATGRGAAVAEEPTDRQTPAVAAGHDAPPATAPTAPPAAALTTPPATRTPSAEQLDLDAILARRRAAGE